MNTPSTPGTTDSVIFAFGPFRLDTTDGVLQKYGQRVPVTPKAVALLAELVRHQGQTLSRSTLLETVWAGTHVEEGTIDFHVHLVRDALGDTPATPQYVATVPRRGYRFIAPVTVEMSPNVLISQSLVKPTKRWSVVVSSILGAFVLLSWWQVRAGSRSIDPWLRVDSITRLTYDGRQKGVSQPLLVHGDDLYFDVAGHQATLSLTAPNAVPRTIGPFSLLDILDRTGEALAIRPGDHGAEDALWIVPLNGQPAALVGAVRTTGHAAWSHDGRRIAFSSGGRLLYTDRTGAEVHLVGTYAGDISDIQWHRSDTTLRFTLLTHVDRRDTWSLWDVSVSGDGLRRLNESGTDGCCGRWRPRGDGFVFVRTAHGQENLWCLGAHWPSPLSRAVVEAVPLTTGLPRFVNAAFSQDGTRLFAIGTGVAELVELNTQHQWVQYPAVRSGYSLTFSGDGQRIAFVSTDGRLLVKSVSDFNPRPITDASLTVSGAAISRDGTRVALRGAAPGARSKIWIVPFKGGSPIPLSMDEVEQGIPSWAPDGVRLTYGDVPEQFGHAIGSEVIHVFDVRRNIEMDVPGSAGFWTSRWSPDGKYIAALTIANQELMLYELSTREWRSLHVRHVGAPTWSVDSRYIYCDPEGPETWIRRVGISSAQIERIVDVSDQSLFVHGAGVTPEGNPLILRRPTDVYALRVATVNQ